MHKAFVEVPSNLISGATLRFIGYDDVTASQLWLWWINWPSDPPLRKLVIATTACHSLNSPKVTLKADMTLWRMMMLYGMSVSMSVEFQDPPRKQIMDPVHRRVRLTRSCLFLMEDTMERRYRTLQSVQCAS
ncbi:hypothetical protein B0T25DRAFT_536162 [Lasiosphaeria hispida]|uniref:Uncharacterized protein n=1 Tax=Lasiosphaeria hispida TaxID=260671 RepID=A0AAJ0MIU6_9PEZI|nr:hypothetical protein B0T25DRAFT_536162 [Lasiosphaeria hispida]